MIINISLATAYARSQHRDLLAEADRWRLLNLAPRSWFDRLARTLRDWHRRDRGDLWREGAPSS